MDLRGTRLGPSPAEAPNACTANAAYVLLLDAADWGHLAYHLGEPLRGRYQKREAGLEVLGVSFGNHPASVAFRAGRRGAGPPRYRGSRRTLRAGPAGTLCLEHEASC